METPQASMAVGEPRSVVASLVIYTQASLRLPSREAAAFSPPGHRHCFLGSRQGEGPGSVGWQEEAPGEAGKPSS